MAISKTCRLVTLALLATAATSLAADPVTDSLVQTERAFAQASVAKGMKDAFLAYLADDSVIFRPAAVPGKAWMQDHPAPPIVLSWRPAYAEVARSGDLGFTTGPYELRSQDPKDTDVGYGTFVTVWKRQAEGAWRVALDLGTSGPQPAEGVSSAVPVEQGTPAAPPGTKGSEAKGEPPRAIAISCSPPTRRCRPPPRRRAPPPPTMPSSRPPSVCCAAAPLPPRAPRPRGRSSGATPAR
jgi:ketosteroid isomerase-like protein